MQSFKSWNFGCWAYTCVWNLAAPEMDWVITVHIQWKEHTLSFPRQPRSWWKDKSNQSQMCWTNLRCVELVYTCLILSAFYNQFLKNSKHSDSLNTNCDRVHTAAHLNTQRTPTIGCTRVGSGAPLPGSPGCVRLTDFAYRTLYPRSLRRILPPNRRCFNICVHMSDREFGASSIGMVWTLAYSWGVAGLRNPKVHSRSNTWGTNHCRFQAHGGSGCQRSPCAVWQALSPKKWLFQSPEHEDILVLMDAMQELPFPNLAKL